MGRRVAAFHSSELIRLVLCGCGYFSKHPTHEMAYDDALEHLAGAHTSHEAVIAEILRPGDT